MQNVIKPSTLLGKICPKPYLSRFGQRPKTRDAGDELFRLHYYRLKRCTLETNYTLENTELKHRIQLGCSHCYQQNTLS